MSNLDRTPQLGTYGGRSGVAAEPVHEVFAGREVQLGSTAVRRLLPNLGRRLVGPWCFVDHYGPDDIASAPGMSVPPHPHLGLQTVSWLLEGEVHHRDSIGSDQLIRPGQLGLMTSGRGIAHAEQSPPVHPALLHGVQLWVALPSSSRDVAPAWAHHADLPRYSDAGLSTTVIMGSVAGAASPGQAYSPIVGADVALAAGADALLPLEPDFEHAVLVTSGSVDVDGLPLAPGSMLYLGVARRDLRLHSTDGARALLLGGEPFAEQIMMWWNFVARSGEEITSAREQWMRGSRFGTVVGGGDPLVAPPVPPGRLKPGGAVR
ncbi:MAG TPA: pirin family protein [Jatrophihabitantaceae bacterium]